VCYNGLFGFTRNALIRDLQVELGENNLTLTRTYGDSYAVGGLVGTDDIGSDTRIINCGVYSPYTLTVTSSSSHYYIAVGGIMGGAHTQGESITQSIANSYAALNISVANNGTHILAAGIVPGNARVENSYFAGTISTNCGYVWLRGIGDGSIQNSYIAGTITNTNTGATYSATGGISLEPANKSVSNSAALLNSITHTNNSNYARIQRHPTSAAAALSNNYAFAGMLLNGSTVTGTADSQNGLDKTAAELKTQSTYESGLGWDFAEVWEMGPAEYPYPILRWQNGQVHIPAGFEVIEDAPAPPPPPDEEEDQWLRTISAGSGQSYFHDIVVDSQGNTYAVGAQAGNDSYDYGNGVTFSGPAGGTYRNAVLVKYDPQGNALWANGVVSGSNTSAFNRVALDSSGSVYVTGEILGSGLSYNFGLGAVTTKASSSTGIIIKYGPDGTALLQKTPESASSSYACFGGIALDSQGNVYVSGFKYGNVNYGNGVTANYGDSNTSSADTTILVKYDSTLTAQWARTPKNTSALNCLGSIAIDSAGDIYSVGYTNGGSITFGDLPAISGSGSTYNAVIVKWDSSGNALWAKTVSSGTNSGFDRVTVYAGAVYASGYQNGTGSYNYGVSVSGTGSGKNPTLVKYEASTGAALWARTLTSGGSAGEFLGVAADETGVYAAGYQTGASAYHYSGSVSAQGASTAKNPVLVRYNADGVALSAHTVSEGTSDSEFRAVFLHDSSVYLAGFQKGTGTYTYAAGSLTGTSSAENAVLIRYSK
jgi:hypothetical protein